ncbi:double-stranded RNA-specific editase 1-like isoform X3 [Aricia agestis]|uniref:double-stranded RNA-specific editase 1-like isoform X3 n=1 Tax=Aricia agestis TaxID=91739 RepID=UPI001C20789D|nr:double-stranded RNA-specific editase 1-like isoform X3 [Aricia agestis]
MSYNKYNTRQSGGRYNTPGRFVPAGQLGTPPAKSYEVPETPQQNFDNTQFSTQFNNVVSVSNQQPQTPQTPKPFNNGNLTEIKQDQTSEMDTSGSGEQQQVSMEEDAASRPHWMKPKLQGVRKISNKERRRRQNETLRRLLSPKNALMTLNEIYKCENTFSVEPVPAVGQFYKPNATNFCASLNLQHNTYKGYGETKMAARLAAAEQAVRDVLLQKMNAQADGESKGPAPAPAAEGASEEELPLPMIQLASFALHKLFADWECQGFRVPQLKAPLLPASDSMSESGSLPPVPRVPRPPKTAADLPANAASMHPCTLLTQMRPGLTYRECAAATQPPNTEFTMEVEVDGQSFTGTATSKRDARKAAARAACQEVFGVRFTDDGQ